MDVSLFRKWIVEFIGTFFLVYVVGCVSLQDHLMLGPLAIGASLMVMIFAGGHLSGAHYNPAVTLGVWIRGACTTLEAGFYLVAQVIGAIVASLAATFLLGHGAAPAASTVTVAQVMLAEALGTFALVYTVLNVATAPATSGNSFYGLAIGFTVFAQAIAVGKISGGSRSAATKLRASFPRGNSPQCSSLAPIHDTRPEKNGKATKRHMTPPRSLAVVAAEKQSCLA